jgi:hypothetical protein
MHYRLFEEFVYLLDLQNDLLLEIEETMGSRRDLHEFRKKNLTQPTHEFKPIARQHRYRALIFEKYSVMLI